MITEQQQKWMRRTTELFMRFGIKSITMDDVARELGISKKTLYQFVENKNDLVMRIIEQHIEEEKEQCVSLAGVAENAIDELFIVMEANTQQMQQMKSNIVYDLQKYHRDAWEKLQEFIQGFLYGIVRRNLERGIRENIYRPDMDVDIIAKLHIGLSLLLFDESLFPQLTYKKEILFKEYLTHYLYGIVSERGLQVLKAKLS
ncbi:MAG: TetR/AcrR family transcriptional regulator [Saprospiraceae bacterium]|nr:TetR/AcrR family transcriptional regulator [Saprospiraceae bacterium]